MSPPYNSRPSAFPGVPPFFQDASISHFYTPENEALIASAWAQSIDPILQSSRKIQDNSRPESKMPFHNQQKPLERFLHQPDNRVLINHEQMHEFPHGLLNRLSAPIQSVPQSSQTRMISPCPSQEPTSTISSNASPGPEPEWFDPQYSPMAQPKDEFYTPPAANPFIGQDFTFTGTCFAQLPSYRHNTGVACVNMNQIQAMPDFQPEEVAYEGADEGYATLDLKSDYAVETKNEYSVEMKQEHHHNNNANYAYHEIDEGIGASIKDEASPQATGSTQTHHSDIDAEGEEEDDASENELDIDSEPIPIDDPLSDTEYTPKRTSSRRKARRTSNPKPIKTGRISKNSPKTKNGQSLTCKQCPTLPVPFRSATELQTHINNTHQQRPYTCVFHFAGCPSTFTSKNEWKRHVSSQHLNLTAWVCELGACHRSRRRSEFNRKDLFTQHLRRMHTPNSVKRNASKRNGEWEERVRLLQTECLVVKREAPGALGCPVRGCETWFEGRGAWDDRMEHVGKHLERGAGEGSGHVDQGDDRYLVSWALREGIVEGKPGVVGEFRLCVGERGGKVEVRDASEEVDVDAEGEDE